MRLKDLCDFVAIQVYPNGRPGELYIGLEHVRSCRFETINSGIAEDVQSSKYAFEAGDVLYGKLRPYLDKAVLVNQQGICTTELLVLRPKSGVDPRFLTCVVHSPDFVNYAVAGVTGVQHPRTSWTYIREYELPDFTHDEQTNIATLLWKAHDSLVSAEAALNTGSTLKRAALRALFSRGLRGEKQRETEFGPAPESWDTKLLDTCATVQTGAAKGRRFSDADVLEVPYLRVANVQDGRLDLTEMKAIRIRKKELSRYRLLPGDVVLTEGGDFDKLGRGFIWRGELDLCVHQNHVFAVRTHRDCLLPEFLAYLAQSAYGKAYFLKVAHKTTNLACINSTKLRAFPVLVPSTLDEQRDIVQVLDAIDRKLNLLSQKRLAIEKLFKVLLLTLLNRGIPIADFGFVPPIRQRVAEVTA